MNPDDTNSPDAWGLARLGFAIDTYVDRQINSPQVLQDHSAAYGMDQNGNLYKVGQPTQVQTLTPAQGGGRITPMMLLLGLGLLYLATK